MICEICGLPIDLCVCDELDKADNSMVVRVDNNRRFGKSATIVEPVDSKMGKKLCSELKKKFATGGTYKNNQIIIMGEHYELFQYMKDEGYDVTKR